jgi:pimeloyl-ACP methyl ester carboxylesterase
MEAFRSACLDRTVGFGEDLRERGWSLDASRLVFAGRWLTPPFGALRFDNRFFLLEWRAADGEPSALPPENDGGEWIEPARALERVAAGGSIAAPPILHLLRVLAEDGPERGRPRLLDTREADLGPMRRIELRPGVLLLPLAAATLPPASHVNTYLLGDGEAILVDPGSPFPAENAKLLAALAAAGEQLGRRVVEIWLTHHHPDHVAGVEALRAAIAEQSVRAEPSGRFGFKFDARWFGVPDRDRPSLGGVRAPTLILRGAESPLLTPAGAHELQRGIPGALLVEVPGAGHHVQMERPRECLAEVLPFLVRHCPV